MPKRGPGRPALPPGERLVPVGVRLTPEEIRALKQAGKREGKRYTALIRDAVVTMLSSTNKEEGEDQ